MLNVEEENEADLNLILSNFRKLNGLSIFISKSLLINFKNLNKKFKSDSQDLGKTEQYVIDAFNTESNACLICIETIGNKEAVKCLNLNFLTINFYIII